MKERAPQAFNIEYEGRSTDQALYDDIVSYLGEYRLRVPKYSYQLKFGGSSFNDLHVKNIYDGEPAYKSAKRAIEEKTKKGLPMHREEAELRGIGDPNNLSEHSLSYQLRFVEDGDTIIWGSRRGAKEEGYGDYDFMFWGTYYKKDKFGGDLEMTAVRIENATFSEFNAALNEFTGTNISFSNADAMLAYPFVIKETLKEAQLDAILRKHFSFKACEEDQGIFKRVIKDLEPSIREFMQHTKDKNILPWQKLQELRAIEHLALELKERYKRAREDNIIYLDDYRPYLPLEQLVRVYQDKELPTVAGSCGASGEIESNNALSFSFRNLLKAIFGENATDYKDDPNLCKCGGLEAHFHCPGMKKISEDIEMPCNKPIIVGEGTTQCTSCGAGQVC